MFALRHLLSCTFLCCFKRASIIEIRECSSSLEMTYLMISMNFQSSSDECDYDSDVSNRGFSPVTSEDELLSSDDDSDQSEEEDDSQHLVQGIIVTRIYKN